MDENLRNPKKSGLMGQFALLMAGGVLGGLVTLSALPSLVPKYIPAVEPASVVIQQVSPGYTLYSAEHQQTAVITATQMVRPSVVGVTRYTLTRGFASTTLAASGAGSGVIISSDGYLVTNNHVIENGAEVRITLADGREYMAEIIGQDPGTDLAVLKISAEEPLPAVVFGDSDLLIPGEAAIAIGNPGGLDLQQTVTLGIISATDRALEVYDWVHGLVQTDAAINPGNSGGPLVNARGEVIGINSVKITGAEGLGFAIPSNLVIQVSQQLMEYGEVYRPTLGVGLVQLTPASARQYGLDENIRGLYVAEVAPGSNADQGGVKPGDVIIAIDGIATVDVRDLRRVLTSKAGEELALEILRGGANLTLSLSLI